VLIKLHGGPYNGIEYELARFPLTIVIPVRSQLSEGGFGSIDHIYKLTTINDISHYEFSESKETSKHDRRKNH